MAASDFILSTKDLHSIFEYRDGDLYWKVFSGNGRIKPGSLAGTQHKDGYKSVRIDGVFVKQHRVIFAMFYGYAPVYVDHIDGNPSNNKIENLRDASACQNSRNAKKPKRNSSGVKGVSWHKLRNKWIASCSVNGSLKHIGYFEEMKEAEKAVRAFRNEHHGNFANHG